MFWENLKYSEAKNFLLNLSNDVGKKNKQYLMHLLEEHFNCSYQETFIRIKSHMLANMKGCHYLRHRKEGAVTLS